MNLFDQYGIKEVADVTLYSIHKKKDGSGDLYYVPALYLDTLKISSAEKTADNVWAEGGLGNSRLICWDYGKQINVSLEDALCTPASLGLCWGGILSSDWKDAEIKHDVGITWDNDNPVEKISRIEKAFYPKNNREKATISNLLPRMDDEFKKDDLVLMKSSVVDGTDIRGFGNVKNHSYKWKMAIESSVKSAAVIPDRFFDYNGKSYPISYNRPIEVTTPTYTNDYFSVIYRINENSGDLQKPPAVIILDETDFGEESQYQIILKLNGHLVDSEEKKTYYLLVNLDDSITDWNPPNEVFDNYWTGIILDENKEKISTVKIAHSESGDIEWGLPWGGSSGLLSHLDRHIIVGKGQTDTDTSSSEDFLLYWDSDSDITLISDEAYLCNAQYLMIQVDNEDNYTAYISNYKIAWQKAPTVDVSQFKGIDMWLRFQSINELIYFLITKYEDDIISIHPLINTGDMATQYEQEELSSSEVSRQKNKLWAFVNPQTMTPYPDDYWFHQGEPYYIKSLTLAEGKKKLKAQKITVTAGQFPGMYMMVGETYIRSRDTGEDERMQIKFPLCKVKSEHSLTLEAAGDPTTFNLELEVARPRSGLMMEITTYETADKMVMNDEGNFEIKDGSTEVLSE